jgi:hypothetical protein
MGGIANDMMSRLIYQQVVDLPADQAKHELGVFGNIIRLSIAITIAIQAFRMAAEPFFFRKSSESDAPATYARIMRYFVLTCCVLFLLISLYIDLVGWFFEAIDRSEWTEGIYLVPLFAMGNIFLGIYYNLSIWYKLTDRNAWGCHHDRTKHLADPGISLPGSGPGNRELLFCYDAIELCGGTKILSCSLPT